MTDKRYTATFDLGTTAVKGVLTTDRGEPVVQCARPIETVYDGAHKEQRPEDWYAAFRAVVAQLLAEASAPQVRGIIMSGQMQDVIPVDAAGRPVGNAVLYMDTRAAEEADELCRTLGEEHILQVTGNAMDASIPAAKILWMRRHQPDAFARTALFLGSPKDYCTLLLCGEAVADVTAAATSGMMDMASKTWDAGILAAVGIAERQLPRLYHCHQRVGEVSGQAAADTGFAPGTPIYAGAGDAGASTLASGVAEPGEYSIYLGTSGWIARMSHDLLPRPGVFNLAGVPKGTCINVVPFLNAGGVHKWVCGAVGPQGGDAPPYGAVDKLLEDSRPGCGGLLFLPYLSGERFPVVDSAVRGCYIGVDNQTAKADLARACLEGVAFSIRQGLEAIGSPPSRITLTGGGAKTPAWRQILADVLARPITVFQNAEYLPAAALTASVLIGQGEREDYGEFIRQITSGDSAETVCPQSDAVGIMEQQYRRYLQVYPAVKGLF